MPALSHRCPSVINRSFPCQSAWAWPRTSSPQLSDRFVGSVGRGPVCVDAAYLPQWAREWCSGCACWQAPCRMASNCRTALLLSSPTLGAWSVGILCCLPIVKVFGCVALPIPAHASRGYGADNNHARCPVCAVDVVRPRRYSRVRSCSGMWNATRRRVFDPIVYPSHCPSTRRTPVRRLGLSSAPAAGGEPCDADVTKECYLVDPASSHMLVSKIKPCMCKYELIQTVKLRMAH